VARAKLVLGCAVPTVHVAASIAAIVAGFGVLMAAKGTERHRALGTIYIIATYMLCGSSFFIFHFSGRLSAFHIVSVQNALLVTAGVALPRYLRRRVGTWYVWHLRFMTYSYVALIVTGVDQFFVFLPFTPAVRAAVFLVLPMLIGWTWIERLTVPAWRRAFTPRPVGTARSAAR
jgi:uncharacterized membrane protein